MAKRLVALWVVMLMVTDVLAEGADPTALLADAESMPGFLPLYWHSDSGDLHGLMAAFDGQIIPGSIRPNLAEGAAEADQQEA